MTRFEKYWNWLRLKARITIDLGDPRKAEAIARSLTPDNQASPGIKIRTKSVGSNVQTVIAIKGRIQTLTATIDDLLRCTQSAEKTLRVAEAGTKSNRNLTRA